MPHTNDRRRGFSLVELILVSSIAVILATLSISTFVNVSDNQSLEKDVDYAVALIEKARTQTINARNSSQYGVRFGTSTVTLFQGKTYSPASSTNSTFDLSSKVEISSVSLSGGADQAAFDFITGKASATGTITFWLKQDHSASSTIVLYKSGFAEVQ